MPEGLTDLQQSLWAVFERYGWDVTRKVRWSAMETVGRELRCSSSAVQLFQKSACKRLGLVFDERSAPQDIPASEPERIEPDGSDRPAMETPAAPAPDAVACTWPDGGHIPSGEPAHELEEHRTGIDVSLASILRHEEKKRAELDAEIVQLRAELEEARRIAQRSL